MKPNNKLVNGVHVKRAEVNADYKHFSSAMSNQRGKCVQQMQMEKRRVSSTMPKLFPF